MRIFLAGASGVIGRALVPLLLGAGHEVVGTTRRADRVATLGCKGRVLDALDRNAVYAALAHERPDVVIHQLTDLAQRDFAANSRLRVTGTRNLVDAARAAGTQQMIVQSVAFAYGPGRAPAHPALEGEPLDVAAPSPRANLVAGILALEAAAAELPLAVILRYGACYGSGTFYAPDQGFAAQARAGKLAATPAVTSFVAVDDAARATLAALTWPAGIVNIVDDEPAPGTAWVPVFAARVGAPPPPLGTAHEAWERGAANQRARELGWRPARRWRDDLGAESRQP